METQVGRMTTDRVADQAMISKLLTLTQKADLEAKPNVPIASGTTPPTSDGLTSPASEEERLAAEAINNSTAGKMVVTAQLVANLNQLLQSHRSSENYVLISAGMMDNQSLYDVVLEVRGQDGSVAKSVYADKMFVTLAPGPQFVELDFEGGFVEYLRGISRRVKSPFFNNRYQIVVLGVASETWINARLPFLKTR
jgi:hypothetical protein